MKRIALAILFVILLACAAFSASPSGKTVDDLVTEVRSFLNESTAAFWTDAEIERWINNGVRNIAARAHCIEETESIVISSATTEYALSSSYVAVKRVLYQSGATAYKALLRGQKEQIGHVDKDLEEPEFFYESGEGVVIYPIKDSSTVTSSGNTIYVVYVPAVSTLSGTSAIPTPEQFDRAIVYYATAQALFKKRFFGSAREYMSQYYDEVDRFRADFIETPEKELQEVVKSK